MNSGARLLNEISSPIGIRLGVSLLLSASQRKLDLALNTAVESGQRPAIISLVTLARKAEFTVSPASLITGVLVSRELSGTILVALFSFSLCFMNAADFLKTRMIVFRAAFEFTKALRDSDLDLGPYTELT